MVAHELTTKAERLAQMNEFSVSEGSQKDDASSREKRIPPIGAWKAAATPEAAPMLTKLRRW